MVACRPHRRDTRCPLVSHFEYVDRMSVAPLTHLGRRADRVVLESFHIFAVEVLKRLIAGQHFVTDCTRNMKHFAPVYRRHSSSIPPSVILSDMVYDPEYTTGLYQREPQTLWTVTSSSECYI